MWPLIEIIVVALILSFTSRYLGSLIGTGYGTIIVPVLLIAGFEPLVAIPSVLLSQMISALAASLGHHRIGNVDFSLGSNDLRTALALILVGMVGILVAIEVAVHISTITLKLFIAIIIILVGIFIIIGSKLMHGRSWKKMIGLGFVASFNKGISGGAFIPVIFGGQLLWGEEYKRAVAITNLTEISVGLIGAIAYLAMGYFDLLLFISLTVGSLIAVPFMVITVKKISGDMIKPMVGFIVVLLGAMLLVDLFL